MSTKVYKKTTYVASQLTEAQRMEIMKKIMTGAMTQEEAYAAVVKDAQKSADVKPTDRLQVSKEKNWLAYIKKEKLFEKVIFSDYVMKINAQGRKQQRIIVITNIALHVPKEYDYWFESKHKTPLLNAIKQNSKVEIVETGEVDLKDRVRTKSQSRGPFPTLAVKKARAGEALRRRPKIGGDQCPSFDVKIVINPVVRAGSTPSKEITSGECPYLAENGMEGEEVQFAEKITKINSWGRRQTRLVAITNKAMYNLSDRAEVKRRVSLERIRGMTISTGSNEFVVHVPSEYDYWFETPLRGAVISVFKSHTAHGLTITEVGTAKLKEYVQGKTKIEHDSKTAVELPQLPSLKHVCRFPSLKDKRDHIRAELVTTEQSYCKSLVQNRNKWVDLFDNFENIVRFHCDFFCPDLQNCVLEDAITHPVSNPYVWATGKKSPTTQVQSAPSSRMSSGLEITLNGSSVCTPTMQVISERQSEAKGRGGEGLAGSGRAASCPTSPSLTTERVGRSSKTTDIGAAFNKRVSLLKTVYEPYLAGWTKLQEAVQRLKEKSKYSKFFNKQQQLTGLGISSYLIMPIQRVPRYVLLIRELVRVAAEGAQIDPKNRQGRRLWRETAN
eukprot:jgi/Bigna1/79190/fgenesh1_pg.60_\